MFFFLLQTFPKPSNPNPSKPGSNVRIQEKDDQPTEHFPTPKVVT